MALYYYYYIIFSLMIIFLTLASGKRRHLFTKPRCPLPSWAKWDRGGGGEPSEQGPRSGSFPYLHPPLAEDHFNK